MRAATRSKTTLVLCGVVVAVVLLAGCSDVPSSQPGSVVGERVALGPVAPRRFVTSPQAAVATMEARVALKAAPGIPSDTSVDARLLVITADGTDAAYAAIVEALKILGTPFDTFNANTEPELTADRLAAGNHGRYQGVILDRGNLSIGSVSAFSSAEWAVLADYEAQFQVRRAALYAYPETIYGLVASPAIDTATTPLTIRCTDDGAALFAASNCTAGITIKGVHAYPATATGATTVPLLVDGEGSIFGAVSADAANHEYLALTFAQTPSLVHSLALIHDVVRWVTRGVFLGERRVYLTSQIDDLFLATEIYFPASIPDAGSVAGPRYRITDLDLQALADWQLGARGQPLTADLRLNWALNGAGSSPTDPLTLRAQALGSSFAWVNHTWDHANLDAMSYADALVELTRNNALVSSLGLEPYDRRNLVTPMITGLNNPDGMRAAFDAGVRFTVSDSSLPEWDNPSPNAGIYSLQHSAILIVPRRSTNLFFNVSTPEVWQAMYNAIYRSYWGRDLSYEEMLDFEANVLVRRLLRGENNPWMFHQANTRDYGGGRSLLSDLHDRVLAKYAAVSKLPIVSDTMDALAGRVAMRMDYDKAQAAAVIGPGAQITVSVVNGAFVPVTGLCTPTAETYAGQKISYLQLAAGAAATFSLNGCNSGGTSGAGGAGGPIATGGIGDMAPDAGQVSPAAPSRAGGGCSLADRSSSPSALWLVFATAGLVGRRMRAYLPAVPWAARLLGWFRSLVRRIWAAVQQLGVPARQRRGDKGDPRDAPVRTWAVQRRFGFDGKRGHFLFVYMFDLGHKVFIRSCDAEPKACRLIGCPTYWGEA